MEISQLENKNREELLELARENGLSSCSGLRKQEIMMKLLQASAEQQGNLFCSGILDIMTDGYGFLRQSTLLPSSSDIYVSQSQIRRFGLRTGDYVVGQGRPAKAGEKYYSLLRVEAINDLNPEISKTRPYFNSLTPIYPDKLIDLETTPENLSSRLINLIAPVGRGQRGLIVAPPKAGKTMLLKKIANAATTNYGDLNLIVCLIGERPEEVTDMRRSVKGQVIAATFDEPVENHTRVAELTLDIAKRMVEAGKDVLLVLDGITRLTRAYNLAMPSSGRTLSGGIDPVALHPAKKFFTARNVEGGGSLTILAPPCRYRRRQFHLKIRGYRQYGTASRPPCRARFPARHQPSGTRRDDLLMTTETIRQVQLWKRMMSFSMWVRQFGGNHGAHTGTPG